MTIEEQIEQLESRCPGCSFSVEERDHLPIIRINEYGRGFTVDLFQMQITAEQWFQDEIDKRPLEDAPPLMPDGKYRVNCPYHGNVIIGYGNYMDQMAKADDGWYCPQCGHRASFDDETYENWET